METIGNWTVQQLVRFIQDQLESGASKIPSGQTVDELTVAQRLYMPGDIVFELSQTTAVAGAASALPATPDKYFRVLDYAGNVMVIPAYKAR